LIRWHIPAPADWEKSNIITFCVMVCCGLIVYYLHEPYEGFEYNLTTNQWKELFREDGKEWWIDDVAIVDDSTIMFTVEEVDAQHGGRYKILIL